MKKIILLSFALVFLCVFSSASTIFLVGTAMAKDNNKYERAIDITKYKTQNKNCIPLNGAITRSEGSGYNHPVIYYKCDDEVVIVVLNRFNYF